MLSLPVATRSGVRTPFVDALFTAVSATCVSGLIVFDTFLYWSIFGQLVILVLIQIGGIGLMSIIGMIILSTRRNLGLHQRKLLMESTGNPVLSEMGRVVRHVFYGTFTAEAIGAILLSIRFCPQLGFFKGIYYGIFHSVSAFCNAGFDLMGGVSGPFTSLTAYENDIFVNGVIMCLIILGGIGFLVWGDIARNKWHIGRYTLHSKIVLTATAFLLIIGWVGFFVFEYSGSLKGMPIGDKLLSSLFMSVTTRTAGFNTLDMNLLSQSGSLLAVFLMFVGGSSGSTAGGIKTSTLFVLVFSMVSMAKGDPEIVLFKKRPEGKIVRNAAAIMTVYIFAVMSATMVIMFIDGGNLTDVLLEVTSAVGTVGLTRGITTSLSSLSQIILALLMFGGRIGGMSMLILFAERKKDAVLKRPTDKIIIG